MAELTRARRMLGRGGGKRPLPGTPPKNKVGGFIAPLLLGLAIVFDVVKAFFATLLITGSLVVGIATVIALDSNSWTAWLPGLVKSAAGALAAIATAGTVGPALEAFGVVTAMMIGFAGWFILIILMASLQINFMHGGGKKFIIIFTGFLLGEVPILDMFPTFTPSMWLIVREENKMYQKALQTYNEEQRVQEEEAQRVHAARVWQLQEAEAFRYEQRLAAENDTEEEDESLAA